MILYCRNAFTIASGSRGSLTVSPIFLVLRSRSHRVDCAGFFEPQCDHERPAEPLPAGLCTHAGWRPAAKSHNEWYGRLMRLWAHAAALELDPQRGREIGLVWVKILGNLGL